MKISSRDIIEIIGIVSVVASLIFVGMQLMLDRRIATADQYQNRAELRMQARLAEFENEHFVQDVANRWTKSRPGWWTTDIEQAFVEDGISMDVMVRTVMTWENFLIQMDNNYYQYQNGLLDQNVWNGMREGLINFEQDVRRYAFSQSTNVHNLNEVIDEIGEELEYEGLAQ